MFARIAAGALFLAAIPALADPVDIDAEPDSTWVHEWTKFPAPPELAGFQRTEIKDLATGQTNIWTTYKDADTATTATIYLFRPGVANVAIWEDRALLSLQANTDAIGKLDLTQTIAGNFTPRSGGGKDSGIIAYGPVSGKDAKSTGLAIFPYDNWLVKIRITSDTLAADALASKLVAVLSAIELPPARIEYPAATEIPACKKALDFSTMSDRGATPGPVLLMMTGLAGAERKTPDAGAQPKVVTDPEYCRDKATTIAYGVYRAKGSEHAYLMAIGDAGLAASVGEYDMPGFLDTRPDRYRGTGGKDYWPMVMTDQRTNIYAPFKGLISPAKMLEIAQSEAPTAAVVFKPEGGTNIILPPPPAAPN